MLENIKAFLQKTDEERSEICESGRFVDQMMESLHSDGKPYSPSRPGVFSSSSLGWTTGKSLCGKYVVGCQRLLAYRYIGFPSIRNTPPRDRFRMDVGTAIHNVVESYLHDLSATDWSPFSDYRDEVWIDPGRPNVAATAFDIRSRTDGTYRVHGHPYVLEIKSIAANSLTKLRSPKPEHLTQLMTYLACLDIPVGNMLYIGLTSALPRKEFMVEFDPAHWRAITDKIDHIRNSLAEGHDLEREGSNYACQRCSYKFICKPRSKVAGRFDSSKVKL